MILKITEPEYVLMKKFIEDHCAIHLERDKEYLIESRLSDLVKETGCRSFQEFHLKARTDKTGKLAERIVDAMTTNETSWFRDKNIWDYIRDIAIPKLIDTAIRSERVSIWCSAVSTGQEAYSLLILLDKITRMRGLASLIERFEILGTDISSTAIDTAMSARYDMVSMNRGMPEDIKSGYFTQNGNYWQFDQELKKRVQYKKFNLQHSFGSLNSFDMILCRNVSIYFSDSFKRELFSKLARALKPGGILLLGSTESLREYSSDFEITYFNNVVVNIRKHGASGI